MNSEIQELIEALLEQGIRTVDDFNAANSLLAAITDVPKMTIDETAEGIAVVLIRRLATALEAIASGEATDPQSLAAAALDFLQTDSK